MTVKFVVRSVERITDRHYSQYDAQGGIKKNMNRRAARTLALRGQFTPLFLLRTGPLDCTHHERTNIVGLRITRGLLTLIKCF